MTGAVLLKGMAVVFDIPKEEHGFYPAPSIRYGVWEIDEAAEDGAGRQRCHARLRGLRKDVEVPPGVLPMRSLHCMWIGPNPYIHQYEGGCLPLRPEGTD